MSAYSQQGVTIRVTQADAVAAATAKSSPEYPSVAKQLKIEGTVALDVYISEAGEVEKVNITSGNPVLTKPAADALKKWKFKPFQVNGESVKALTSMTFSFKNQ
jgi:protein TonB